MAAGGAGVFGNEVKAQIVQDRTNSSAENPQEAAEKLAELKEVFYDTAQFNDTFDRSIEGVLKLYTKNSGLESRLSGMEKVEFLYEWAFVEYSKYKVKYGVHKDWEVARHVKENSIKDGSIANDIKALGSTVERIDRANAHLTIGNDGRREGGGQLGTKLRILRQKADVLIRFLKE